MPLFLLSMNYSPPLADIIAILCRDHHQLVFYRIINYFHRHTLHNFSALFDMLIYNVMLILLIQIWWVVAIISPFRILRHYILSIFRLYWMRSINYGSYRNISIIDYYNTYTFSYDTTSSISFLAWFLHMIIYWIVQVSLKGLLTHYFIVSDFYFIYFISLKVSHF